MGILKLLVTLHIDQALQDLLQQIFHLILLKSIAVVFAIVYQEMCW